MPLIFCKHAFYISLVHFALYIHIHIYICTCAVTCSNMLHMAAVPTYTHISFPRVKNEPAYLPPPSPSLPYHGMAHAWPCMPVIPCLACGMQQQQLTLGRKDNLPMPATLPLLEAGSCFWFVFVCLEPDKLPFLSHTHYTLSLTPHTSLLSLCLSHLCLLCLPHCTAFYTSCLSFPLLLSVSFHALFLHFCLHLPFLVVSLGHQSVEEGKQQWAHGGWWRRCSDLSSISSLFLGFSLLFQEWPLRIDEGGVVWWWYVYVYVYFGGGGGRWERNRLGNWQWGHACLSSLPLSPKNLTLHFLLHVNLKHKQAFCDWLREEGEEGGRREL